MKKCNFISIQIIKKGRKIFQKNVKKENSTEVVEVAEYPSSTSHFQEAVVAGDCPVVVEEPHNPHHKTVEAVDPIHLHSTRAEALLEPVEDPSAAVVPEQLLHSFQVEPLLVEVVVLEAANHPIAAVEVDPTAVAAASEELQALLSLVEAVPMA